MTDLHERIESVQTLDPAVTVTARASAPVDRSGWGFVDHIVMFGASGDGLSPERKIEARLEASGDGTNWTAVTAVGEAAGEPLSAAGVFATVDAPLRAQREYRVRYRGEARYSRVFLVLTGAHQFGVPVAALALLGERCGAYVG